MNKIQIDRIAIQGKGIEPSVAQESVRGLGEVLMGEISQKSNLLKSRDRIEIGDLNLGNMQVNPNQDASLLRQAIAKKITEAIINKLTTKGGR